MRYAINLLLLSAFLFAPPCAVQASLQVGDHIRFGDGPGSPGGIFHIDDLNDDPVWNFDTFCVELEEHVQFNKTYAVESIGLTTHQTGRTLTSISAWLYNSFLDQTLSGFNFASPTAAQANTLQFAIWKGLGYTKSQINAATNNWCWYDTYDAKLASKGWEADFAADSSWSGTGRIFVMNLRKVNQDGVYLDYAQDQLVRMPLAPPPPDKNSHMPEPMSVVIWGAVSLVGLAYRRWRRTEARG